MKKTLFVLLISASTVFSAAVFAQDTEQIMEQRSANFKQLKKASGEIKDLLGSASLNTAKLTEAGNLIVKNAKAIPGYFPASTKDEIDSEAEPKIWEDMDGFKTKAANLASAGEAFLTAVASNDKAKIQNAFGDIGKNCKACHKEYRK